jgi:hypothetical protein
MSQISPPIRILVVCAVAFLAAWMLFLRPSSDAGTPAAETPPVTTPVEAGGEQADSLAGKAVEQANEAQAAADARVDRIEKGTETAADANSAANAQGSESASGTGAAQPNAAKPAAGKAGAKAAAKSGLPLRVLQAIGDHKVVVLLFWSPKSADDKAVRKALAGIDRHDGKVLAHATHLKRISRYSQITRGANVQQSPTVLVIDRKLRVVPLVGYVDRVTIDQAVTDALRTSK